jgi:tryptophan synthase alpha chain
MKEAPTAGLEAHIRARLKEKPLLIMAHAVAGYPSADDNKRMLESMEEAGVDLVELQLPFSEPIADGPLFVKANQEAVLSGMRWEPYFELLSWTARSCSFPVLFMGYYNSAFRMGETVFCERLAAAGAKGYILADLPPEEGKSLAGAARRHGLDPVLIMTPASPPERLREIGELASGFVYCVARKGVTGRRTDISGGVQEFLERARRATPLPLGLGFGLKTPEDVRALRGKADIAIVGTACLEAWERGGPEGYRRFLNGLVAQTR